MPHLHVNSDVFISVSLCVHAAIYLHPTQNRFSHLSRLRCWQKHSITLAGCKFPAHWSSVMPQRSKTDWNLCSHSSISSVTWLCQRLSTVPPNKLTMLLAAGCQVFTFAGNKFIYLFLMEVMIAFIKIWFKDLWSSDMANFFLFLCVKKSREALQSFPHIPHFNYILELLALLFIATFVFEGIFSERKKSKWCRRWKKKKDRYLSWRSLEIICTTDCEPVNAIKRY